MHLRVSPLPLLTWASPASSCHRATLRGLQRALGCSLWSGAIDQERFVAFESAPLA
jgi:hypothetical protein